MFLNILAFWASCFWNWCFLKKSFSYLKKNNDEDKKSTKKCVIKRKLKFQDYKSCLRPAEIEYETNYLEKKKYNLHNLKEALKEFIKSKLILKTQQRFKRKKHNVFTEVINKSDIRMKSIVSTEIYPYGMYQRYKQAKNKQKEKNKRYNITQRCLTLIVLQNKTK